MGKTRLYFIDDHKMVIDMWSTLLGADQRYEIVGKANDGETALSEIKDLYPNIILLDISMPGLAGVPLLKQIKALLPSVKVLAVSMHTNMATVKNVLHNGARGYVSKTSTYDEMIAAIEAVKNGENYLSSDIKDQIVGNLIRNDESEPDINTLTRRELEIAQLIKEGLTSKEISERLYISLRTVEVHRHNLFKKLNVRNAAGLINLINQ